MDNYNRSNLNIVPEDEPLRLEGTQTATGEEQSTSTSRHGIVDDVAGSKPKGRPATDVPRVEKKVRCCKEIHTIGTWNVRTMNQGKLDVVKAEMSKLNINILGISEIKWTGMGHFVSDEYEIFYCGHETRRKNGVAIMVNKLWSKSILGYNPKNDRMISIRFQGKPINITVIQVYAPTTDAMENEIEQFYADLQQLLDTAPRKDAVVIMGDWNAKVGSTTTSGITGKFGLGMRNEAGDKLIDFCQSNSMFIANTFFQQPKRRLYTWTSPGGQYRNQIDYILFNQRWRSAIQSSKTRPGADCGSDHELLVAKIQIKLKKTGKFIEPPRYDLANIPQQYAVMVKNRFDGLDLVGKMPEEIWTEIKDIIKDEAIKNIPKRKKQKKAKWLSAEALKVADERRQAKTNGDEKKFSQLNAEFQRMARRDKGQYMNEQCKEVEENNRKGRTRDLFKKISGIKGKFHAKWSIIKDKYGNELFEKADIKKRWYEHTEELYKKDPSITDTFEGTIAELEPDILESEVKWAIESIAKNKASGIDDISIELLKVLQDDAVKVILPLCQQIWTTQQWPKDWKRTIYVPIPKKGSATDCSNYRTIALIPHTSKIMLKILQARMQQYMERELPDVQAGFKRGRGTRDQIANIRWIMETTREYQKDIYFCFIDYTKAFDCVDHNKLWITLHNMGVPGHLIQLLKNLYADQEATVRTEYGLTEWFKIRKGVRQGCILSPYLFNLYAEHIMRNVGIEETEIGIKIGGRNINNLRYADDTTLMAENEEDLKTLLLKVKEESAKAGLLLNVKKTKIMSTGNATGILIDGEEIEVVTDFIFLGSKINIDGDCTHEIKRRLLLGRKAMVNLDNILKSRDVTLTTKVRIVKAMVFPVVTYGSESWTIKKADRRSIDAFELWCWRKLLRIPWTARRTNHSILEEVKQDLSLEALIMKLKLKYFGHIMRRQESLEKTLMLGKTEGSRKRGRQKTRWLDTITDVMEKNIQELNVMVTDREAWRANVHQVTKSRNRLND